MRNKKCISIFINNELKYSFNSNKELLYFLSLEYKKYPLILVSQMVRDDFIVIDNINKSEKINKNHNKIMWVMIERNKKLRSLLLDCLKIKPGIIRLLKADNTELIESFVLMHPRWCGIIKNPSQNIQDRCLEANLFLFNELQHPSLKTIENFIHRLEAHINYTAQLMNISKQSLALQNPFIQNMLTKIANNPDISSNILFSIERHANEINLNDIRRHKNYSLANAILDNIAKITK